MCSVQICQQRPNSHFVYSSTVSTPCAMAKGLSYKDSDLIVACIAISSVAQASGVISLALMPHWQFTGKTIVHRNHVIRSWDLVIVPERSASGTVSCAWAVIFASEAIVYLPVTNHRTKEANEQIKSVESSCFGNKTIFQHLKESLHLIMWLSSNTYFDTQSSSLLKDKGN